jgi:hypothetical protein
MMGRVMLERSAQLAVPTAPLDALIAESSGPVVLVAGRDLISICVSLPGSTRRIVDRRAAELRYAKSRQ